MSSPVPSNPSRSDRIGPCPTLIRIDPRTTGKKARKTGYAAISLEASLARERTATRTKGDPKPTKGYLFPRASSKRSQRRIASSSTLANENRSNEFAFGTVFLARTSCIRLRRLCNDKAKRIKLILFWFGNSSVTRDTGVARRQFREATGILLRRNERQGKRERKREITVRIERYVRGRASFVERRVCKKRKESSYTEWQIEWKRGGWERGTEKKLEKVLDTDRSTTECLDDRVQTLQNDRVGATNERYVETRRRR